MTNKELVAAGHALAKAQGADAPLTEIAKLVSDLATRLDVITVLSDVLTAENLALKNYIDGECYTESKRTGVYTCAGINKPASPATDAMVNEIRAEVIPDGYVLVPQQMCLPASSMEAICFHCGDGDHMFGEFTDGILWVGEIDHGDGNRTYGLNISTADYPDEGSGVVCEFINPNSDADAAKDGE